MMFTRRNKILMNLAVLFIGTATLGACSKGADFRAARSTTQGPGISGNGSASCGVTTQTVGRVFDNGLGGAYSFEQRVKGLLAASVDPQYFGSISGDIKTTTTGVSLEGKIVFDFNGTVNASKTSLKLAVTDSFVGTKDDKGNLIVTYPMNFSTASSGTVDLAEKTFTVVFKDSYGEITVTGNFKTAVTTGIIAYTNFSTIGGGDYPLSAPLGSYQISTCSFIQE